MDILQKYDFNKVFFLDLSGIKLTNIDFIKNKTMHNLTLYLNNNLIDDINILTNEIMSYYNRSIKITQNPIRKGLHALKNNYVRCVYLELDIIKTENEFKICA